MKNKVINHFIRHSLHLHLEMPQGAEALKLNPSSLLVLSLHHGG